MSQQKLSKRIKRKIISFFKSLCGSTEPSHIQLKESSNTIQAKQPQKRKRLTFLFDQVLIKLTRKNIVLEQFQNFSYGVALPPSLEKHIAQRINNITIAVFHGHFSDRAMKSVIYPIKVIQKQLCFQSTGNLILSKNSLELREGIVEAYVVQVKEKSCKAIQEMLTKYYQQISRFVFICHEEVKSSQIMEVFKIFRGRFMYELERVMILDKCISTIVYISNSREFLNIDKESLLDFYLSEVAKEHPSLDKKEFAHILGLLLDAQFYIEVAATLGQLMNRQINRFRDNFLRTITQKFPYVTPFLKGMQIQKAASIYETPFLEKSIYEPTPLFQVRDSTSNYPYKEDQEYSEMGMMKMQPPVKPKKQGMSFQ